MERDAFNRKVSEACASPLRMLKIDLVEKPLPLREIRDLLTWDNQGYIDLSNPGRTILSLPLMTGGWGTVGRSVAVVFNAAFDAQQSDFVRAIHGAVERAELVG